MCRMSHSETVNVGCVSLITKLAMCVKVDV